MLEAGRNYDPTSETPMFNPLAQRALRGAGTPPKPFGFYDATVDGGWTVPKEPYLVRRSRKGRGWHEGHRRQPRHHRPKLHVVARPDVGRAGRIIGPDCPAHGAV